MVKILDCTTRDGGHITNWSFDNCFVMDLLLCLNKSGVSFYEIGYRNHFDNQGKGQFYNCSPEFLKQFYTIKGNIKLGVMTDTTRYSPKDFQNRLEDYIDFVRIACHQDKIAQTLQISEDLHDRGYEVFVQLMDISNVDEKGYKILENLKNKNILEALYCADSYGTIQPDDLEKIFERLKTAGYKKISFHGHNTSGMALQNTLKAVELGAYSVDVTLNGIGRSGGNLNAVELLNSLAGFESLYYKTLSRQ